MARPDRSREGDGDRRLFVVTLALLSLLALWPVWSSEFLPLQDHPRHLLIAQVLHAFDDPAFDWREHWEVDRQFGPYALAYAVLEGALAITGVETAGRLLVSLYLLGVGIFALRESHRTPDRAPPWPLLLALPLAFSPIYFLGLQNYLLSIPLLFLSLQELEAFGQRPARWRSSVSIALLQLLLFLAHPYTLLVYAGLAVLLAIPRTKPERLRMLAPPAMLIGVFGAWALLSPTGSSALPPGASTPQWWHPLATLQFALLPFVGMRFTGGIAWSTLIVWLGIAGVFATAHRAATRDPSTRGRALILGSLLLGVASLPFSVALYTYLNVRLLPLALVAGVWLLARLPLGRIQGLACAAGAALLLVSSAQLQTRLSEEIGEISGILSEMEPNAALLPIVADGASRHLDRRFFYQFHTHVPDYYHLRVGGGISPAYRGFTSRLMPARPRPESRLPSARSRNLDWKRIDETFRYLVARGLGDNAEAVVMANAALRARSGEWALYETETRPVRR